jgi:hypothetical protein
MDGGNLSTAQEFLEEIIEIMKYQFFLESIHQKRTVQHATGLLKSSSSIHRLSRNTSVSSSSNVAVNAKSPTPYNIDSPISILENLFAAYQQNSASDSSKLFIVIKFAEKLTSEIFGQILKLFRNSQIHVHFALCHSISTPLRVHLSLEAKYLCRFPLMEAMKSNILYERVMSRILLSSSLPTTLPTEAIAWIHESFFRSERCVHSAVQHVLLCFKTHFKERISLISMCDQSQWLCDMRLIKSLPSSKENHPYEKNLAEILKPILFLEKDDLHRTGLPSDINFDVRMKKVTETMIQSIAIMKFRYIFYHIFLVWSIFTCISTIVIILTFFFVVFISFNLFL